MSYGRIWCEKVRLIKKRILGKGHQMRRVLQPQRERGEERERERECKGGGVERKTWRNIMWATKVHRRLGTMSLRMDICLSHFYYGNSHTHCGKSSAPSFRGREETRRFYTETLFTQDVFYRQTFFTHSRFHTETLLHAQKTFYTRTLTHRPFYTHIVLHTDAFTHKGLYTQKLLHTDTFTDRDFLRTYPTDTFTHRHIYTQKLLHQDAFSTQKLLLTDSCTHRRSYRQKPVTHRRFYRPTLVQHIPTRNDVFEIAVKTSWLRSANLSA